MSPLSNLGRSETGPWQPPLEWTDPDGDGFKIHADEPGRFATIEVKDSADDRTTGVYVDEADAQALIAWFARRLGTV